MSRFTHKRDEENNQSRLVNKDNLYCLGLLIVAIALYTSNLGELPLRDWDEGIVAGVARNIWRAAPGEQTWLYPTINYDEPYWNKPPLVHWLIALSYSLFGVSEWSTRLFPAILSAFSVPLLYKIGKEIFPTPPAPVLSALVYLTLLPIARHGRVAMLDGVITFWFCGAVFCLLRGRKYSLWLIGTGLGIGMISMTKGIMMGILLGSIILVFTYWELPRLIRNNYLWIGFILGMVPPIAWYGLQYSHYGNEFLGISLGQQTFSRIWEPVRNVSSPPWYYFLEIAKYTLPWLIFLPKGIKLAIKNRHLTWSKLTLTWGGIYLLAISLMATKLPWYVIPVYPALAILVGNSLAIAWQKQNQDSNWKICLSFVAMVCWLGGSWYSLVYLTSGSNLSLAVILLLVAITFTIAALLMWLSSRYFISVLIAGFYLALLLLFNSNNWLWELNEAFPVRPIAQKIKEYTPPQKPIFSSYPNYRPSLEFYSDRVIAPTGDQELRQQWQQKHSVYLLVDQAAIDRLSLKPHKKLGDYVDDVTWQLITQADDSSLK